jgi:hypothetical protein
MQKAACYTEAGHATKAVHLYQESLSKDHFCERDYGFFLSWMALSLAQSGEPDYAAEAGLTAVKLAAQTSSVRTRNELTRVVKNLEPWRDLPSVKKLLSAVGDPFPGSAND